MALTVKVLAIFAILLAGIYIVISFVNKEGTPSVYEFCKYDAEDYETLNAGLKARYPIGSKAGPLINAIQKSSGYEQWWDKHPTPDFLYGPEPEFLGYGFTYECQAGHGNVNQWYILFLTDSSQVITAFEFRLLFDDQDFKARGIPFRLENFNRLPIAKKALQSIAGKGTKREKVREIMESAGVTSFDTKTKDRRIIDKYRKHPDKMGLGNRLGAFRIWILLWEFDEDGELLSLELN